MSRLRRLGVWGVTVAAGAILALGIALSIPGCAVGYVARQSASHLRVLASRQPVDRAIARDRVPQEWIPKIELIQDAKRFAVEHLELPAADLYETISLVRPEPTWVVTAAPRDALEPVTWWFPIVGRVAYRGYYDRQDAADFAARLRRRDLDVLVQAAGAFSTLGWFSDPIRPSMLERSGSSLVNLVLHEAAHRRLYVKGQTDFNESFASFVGDAGTLLYYRAREGEACPTCARVDALNADATAFSRFLRGVVEELEALYGGPASREEKLRLREEIFAGAQARYREMEWETRAYDGFADRALDNAVILSLVRYEGRREPFHRLLAACHGDLPRAVRGIVSRVEKRETDPFGQVESLAGAEPPCPP